MIDEIKPYLNFTQLLVVLTFCYFLITWQSRNKLQRILLFILAFDFMAELLNLIFLVNKKTILIGIVYSFMSIIQNSLWILIMYRALRRDYLQLVLTGYLVFSLLNLFFYEGFEKFNHYTFIVGALLYIIIFIYESTVLLKQENLSFLLSNNYLLLASPIVFMMGLSILISFNSRILNSAIVFNGMPLYNIIGYFTNFIYYSMLLVYCYRVKRR